MSTNNDGGPAFPFGQVSERTGQPINGFFNPGMTLRDYFAGQALAGFCANQHCAPTTNYHYGNLAEDAYAAADAMLAVRERKGDSQ